MKLDNPAERLHTLLLAGKSIHKNTEARVAWRSLLNLNENEIEYVLILRIGSVMALPSQVMEIMSNNFTSDRWKTSHWLKVMETAFSKNNLNSNWSNFIDLIDDRTLTELGMLSTIIETKGHVETIDRETLENFKSQINSIKNEVINNESIDENLKKTIAKYLKKIIDAIDNYQISGVEPIMEAIEAAIGHTAIDEDYRNALKSEGLGKKLGDVLGAIANSITIAEGLAPLGVTILKLFSNS